MTETYIIKHNIQFMAARILVRIFALVIAFFAIGLGVYIILPVVLLIIMHSFASKAVDVNYKEMTYSQYASVWGMKLFPHRGTLSYIKYILIKDTTFVSRRHRGIVSNNNGTTFLSDNYEVALVGEKRFKLVLLYTLDTKKAIDTVLKIQTQSGFPIRDLTHEQVIGENY